MKTKFISNYDVWTKQAYDKGFAEGLAIGCAKVRAEFRAEFREQFDTIIKHLMIKTGITDEEIYLFPFGR